MTSPRYFAYPVEERFDGDCHVTCWQVRFGDPSKPSFDYVRIAVLCSGVEAADEVKRLNAELDQ